MMALSKVILLSVMHLRHTKFSYSNPLNKSVTAAKDNSEQQIFAEFPLWFLPFKRESDKIL